MEEEEERSLVKALLADAWHREKGRGHTEERVNNVMNKKNEAHVSPL